MRVKTLKGKECNWTPEDSSKGSRASAPHKRARALLATLFPLDRRLEEVKLPGGRLRCDFYLPTRKMMVEVHGEQHYEHTAFFHGHPLNFLKSKSRDTDKRKWAEVNGIDYVELPHDEPDEVWRARLLGRHTEDDGQGQSPR